MILDIGLMGLRWLVQSGDVLFGLNGWGGLELNNGTLVLMLFAALFASGCRTAARQGVQPPEKVEQEVAEPTPAKRAGATKLVGLLVGATVLGGCSGGAAGETGTDTNQNQEVGGGSDSPLSVTTSDLLVSGPEGGPFSEYQNLLLKNNTADSLTWSASFNENWAFLDTASGVLASNEEITVKLALNQGIAAGFGETSRSGTLTVRDLTSDTGETTIQRSVGLVVANESGRMDVTAPACVIATGPVGGPFAVTGGAFDIVNVEGYWLDWRASSSVEWLTLSQSTGRAEPGVSSQIELTVGVDAQGAPVDLPAGEYTAQVTVVNMGNGGGEIGVPIHLTVGGTNASTGTTYFVDFDGGSDASAGDSPTAAWKHCPGDSEALGVPAGTLLQPGDHVKFKGGVNYRGSIRSQTSGALGAPIIFDGNSDNSYGFGKAIIDGSEKTTGWTQVGPNLYSTSVPADADPFSVNLFERGQRLILAQGPTTPSDPLRFDDTDEYRAVDLSNVTPTTVTDPAYLGTLPTNFWQGAYIAIWAPSNTIFTRAMTGYDAATGTLSFEGVSSVYTDRDTYYSILNSESVLDQAGEYYVDESSGTLYVWPHDVASLAAGRVSMSVRAYGFDLAGKDYQTVRGFQIIKHAAGFQGYNMGLGIRNSSAPLTGALLENNEIAFSRSMERAGALTLYNATNSTVRGNFIHRNMQNRGTIFSGCDNLSVASNTLFANGGTAIIAFTCTNSRIARNGVYNHRGVHANGITLYIDCRSCVVEGNVVLGGIVAATFQNSSDLLIRHNIFNKAPGIDNFTVADWGGCEDLKYYNNVILSDLNKALVVGANSEIGAEIKNNIIDGALFNASNVEASHNLYTSLAWTQSPGNLGLAEMYEPNLDVVFENLDQGRFGLAAGSPAIDAGVDLNGTDGDIVYGNGVDIGAVEYRP